MTGTTISGVHLSPVTLSNAATQNPAYIASGATISVASSSALVGLSGTDWTITNYGLIEGFGEVGTGISLASSGTIFNQSSATSYGANHGIALGGGGTVFNQGTIAAGVSGTSPAAVYMDQGGYVTNMSGGVISATSGASDGIVGLGAFAVTVANQGTITAASKGVYIDTGGSVTNQSGGQIRAGGDGIELLVGAPAYTGWVANQSGGTILSGSYGIYVSSGTAINQGYISASSAGLRLAANSTGTNASGGTIAAATGTGVQLYGGGSFTNQSGATISAEYGVRVSQGAGTVDNQGAISASNDGIVLAEGGYVTNEAGGIITGAVSGVVASGGATTLLNAGTIAGSGAAGYAVTLATGFTDRLIVDPGAVFIGTVSGGNAIGGGAISTLELASGASGGTLTGLGNKYVDFAQITIDAGAAWTSTANVVVTGATLTNRGEVYGALTLAAGAVLTNAAGGLITSSGFAAVYGSNGGPSTLVNAGSIGESVYYGVSFDAGGIVRNVSGGTITGADMGVLIYGAGGSLVNAGSIAGGLFAAVELGDGGQVTNQTSGVITGYGFAVGVGIFDAAGTVVNSGSIAASFQSAVLLDNGGQVTNQSGATITGYAGADGVAIYNATGTVTNFGAVTSTGGSAIYVAIDGHVTNHSGGTVVGQNAGVILGTSGTVVNDGRISGGNAAYGGVVLKGGGQVTNQGSGVIAGYAGADGVSIHNQTGTVTNFGTIGAGSATGVYLANGGQVTNQSGGTISGGTDAVYFHSGFVNRMVIDPGAVFNGTVDGGNTIGAASVSTLELASGASIGTLTGLGSTYLNFAQVAVDGGASWLLSAGNTIVTGATLTDSGTLTNAGTLLDNGALNGGGTLVNDGSISVVTKGGLSLSGGALTNTTHGTISSYNGIAVTGGGSVVSAGLITGTASQGYGVYLQGGSLTNQQGGTIEAVYNAVVTLGGIVTNDGLIDGTGAVAVGIQAQDGGLIINAAHATITAPHLAAIAMYGIGTVSNAGIVSGSRGIFLFDGGTVTNLSGGAITGATFGIQAVNASSSTVINAGTISATDAGEDAVSLAAGNTNRVVIDPDAVFTGTVDGGNAIGAASISTLELAPGASIGTLTGLGSTYVDFAQVTVDSGASWLLSGGNTIVAGAMLTDTGTLTNAGTLLDDGTLTDSGMLTNTGTLLDNGALNGGGTLVNDGSISVVTKGGLSLSGGALTNTTHGTISSYNGIAVTGGGPVVNAGLITGSASQGYGVYLQGGPLTNQQGGTIEAVYNAVVSLGGTVTNDGLIDGTGEFAFGVQAEDGGLIINAAHATITAPNFVAIGVYTAAGTVSNAGIISGSGGIYLFEGGTVTNLSGGAITGAKVGVQAYSASSTVINAGTISATDAGRHAVSLAAGNTNRVVIDPGAVFTGTVDGGNAIGAASISTLELASGASIGTLTGLGSQYVYFSAITIDSAAAWTLTGGNTLAAGTTFTNAGTLTLSSATLSDAGVLVNNGGIVLDPSTMVVGDLIGSGAVTIDAGTTLEVLGSIASSQTVVFAGSGGYLDLVSPGSVAGSVTGFGPGETIGLNGIAPGSVSYSGGELLIKGVPGFPLALAAGNTLQIGSSGDGTELTAICFCADTLIATPSGQVKVQDLAAGDLVTTWCGEARPIVWIGTGAVLATRGRRNAATPVVVRKGALADNVPTRNLRVTKGHALYVDDVLIPVEFLVNHRSIVWDDRAQEVKLFHIELQTHDVLIANGAPAESYRDDGNRWLFRNGNSGWHLPPREPYAPVLTGGAVVDAVWSRLLMRAGPRPGLRLTEDPDLHLLVDGHRVEAASRLGAYVFRLPSRVSLTRGSLIRPFPVRIVSRAGAPAELGLARDPRVLGVALRRIALHQGMRCRVIEAEDPVLAEGFHGFEPDNGLRWTDGDAAVPAALFDGFDGTMELVLHVGCTTQYALFGEPAARAAI